MKYLAATSPLLLLILAATPIMCQRPGYAGARPSGLSQKDKYFNTQFGSSAGLNTTSDVALDSRFGVPETNVIAFGVPQRPPVGYQIVPPQATYVPIAAPPRPLGVGSPQQQTPQFALDNRIGGTDGAANQPQAPTPTQEPLPYPLDAHGDEQLIQQLSQLPVDQRPFWFLNYQAIEAQRNNTAPSFTGAIASRGSFFG